MDAIKLTHAKLRLRHHRSKPGSEPGTISQHADLAKVPVTLTVVAFNDKEIIEQQLNSPEEILPLLSKYTMTWLNICGLGDLDVLSKVIKIFNLNSLAMEDVVNVPQRPKVEEYGDVFFAIMSEPEIIDHILGMQQISMFWGKNFVLTFQDRATSCFSPLKARMQHGDRRHRMLRSEYLSYALLDAVIDDFFPVLELYGTELDSIEERAIDNTSTAVIVDIHNFKHNLHLLRRAVWAQREAMASFKEIAMQLGGDIRFFVRDCEDHTIQLIDVIESYRERTSGLMDIYLSSVSNRTNRIVKVLTIITAILMPINVLAAIYGMNFDRSMPGNMPELSWEYGYAFFWLLAATSTTIMLLAFWRKGWFSN